MNSFLPWTGEYGSPDPPLQVVHRGLQCAPGVNLHSCGGTQGKHPPGAGAWFIDTIFSCWIIWFTSADMTCLIVNLYDIIKFIKYFLVWSTFVLLCILNVKLQNIQNDFNEYSLDIVSIDFLCELIWSITFDLFNVQCLMRWFLKVNVCLSDWKESSRKKTVYDAALVMFKEMICLITGWVWSVPGVRWN